MIFHLRMSSSLSKKGVCVVLQKPLQGFLSKQPLLLLWVMRIYIVQVNGKKVTLKILQAESFVDISRDGFSRKVLTNLTTQHDSSAFSHVLHTWSFAGYSSRELVMNCTDSSLNLDSSPISHTHPLQINPHKYREMIEEITIKFGTELKQTKASWKLQLQRLIQCRKGI